MKKNDIAFPVDTTASFNVTIEHKEMTLRDYFAAKAMQSLVAELRVSRKYIASISYEIADDMLKERGK